MRRYVRHTALNVLMWGILSPWPPGAHGESPRLAPDDFALLAWNMASGDQRVFEQMYECGFNLAGFVRPEDLDAVAAAGLKCIVHDPAAPVRLDPKWEDARINEQVAAYTARAGTHPAVFGYYLADEPGARLFAVLAKWVQAFRAVSPYQMPYINLAPNYASPEQLGADNYTRHVESFIKQVAPAYVSYDHYALMEDGSLREGYFQNLEIVRKAALRHAVPFWTVALSTACHHYAEPTEAGLRFQAYATLAYGGRGIGWFTYFSQPVGNFRLAPIDAFGEKTATWHALRRVNLQIHQLGPTYVTLQSVNVFHDPHVPHGCQGIKTSRHLSELTGGNLLVGEFEDRQRLPYVLVVNKGLRQSVHLAIRFKTPGSIWQFNAYTGQRNPFGDEHAWLAPGQGMLLMLQPAASGKEARPSPATAGAK